MVEHLSDYYLLFNTDSSCVLQNSILILQSLISMKDKDFVEPDSRQLVMPD